MTGGATRRSALREKGGRAVKKRNLKPEHANLGTTSSTQGKNFQVSHANGGVLQSDSSRANDLKGLAAVRFKSSLVLSEQKK